MTYEGEFLLTLGGLSAKDSDQLIGDLEITLQRNGYSVSRTRSNESTQDFGATLVLVLGAPAVVIAAKALRDWVNRKNAKLVIRTKNGEVVAEGLDSKDASAVAAALSSAIATGGPVSGTTGG